MTGKIILFTETSLGRQKFVIKIRKVFVRSLPTLTELQDLSKDTRKVRRQCINDDLVMIHRGRHFLQDLFLISFTRRWSVGFNVLFFNWKKNSKNKTKPLIKTGSYSMSPEQYFMCATSVCTDTFSLVRLFMWRHRRHELCQTLFKYLIYYPDTFNDAGYHIYHFIGLE